MLDTRVSLSENDTRYQFKRWTKILLIIYFVIILWVLVVAAGTYTLNLGYSWAALPFELWMYSLSAVIAFFIFLQIILVLRYKIIEKKQKESAAPKPEYYDGYKIVTYTCPKQADAGFFGRTYIRINDKQLLRLRTLIIPADELWEADQ